MSVDFPEPGLPWIQKNPSPFLNHAGKVVLSSANAEKCPFISTYWGTHAGRKGDVGASWNNTERARKHMYTHQGPPKRIFFLLE